MLVRGTMSSPRRPWQRMQTSMVALAVQLSCMVLPWQLQGVLKADLLYKQFYPKTPNDYSISILQLQLRTTYSVILLNNNTRRTVLYIAGISLVVEINVSHHSCLMMWMPRLRRVSSKQHWCDYCARAGSGSAHRRWCLLHPLPVSSALSCCLRVTVWHRHVWICCNGYWHTVHLL